MLEWISTKERLPEKDGQYIVAIKDNINGKDPFIVRSVNFAKSLYRSNVTFPGWDNNAKSLLTMEEDYKKKYDHPGFYYTYGYGEGEELDIGIEDMCVSYWMPYPDPPLYIENNTLISFGLIPQ